MMYLYDSPRSVSNANPVNFLKPRGRRVLILGTDEILLRSREAILRRAGYEARGVHFLRVALPKEAYEADLVILCQTLHEARAEAIRRLLRERGSRATILRMTKLPSTLDEGFFSLDGPAALLAKVAKLLP